MEGYLSDEYIHNLYYEVDFFKRHVKHIILPPSKHYWRVRATYMLFGHKKDSKHKPFFNETAWKKADGLLKEILVGHVADSAGLSFYSMHYKKKRRASER